MKTIFTLFVIILIGSYSSCSVIIVGSGLSGLSTAYTLLKNGIKDVTILEAEGRYGGRTYSIPYGTAELEIGAQWLLGQNPLYHFLNDLNLNIIDNVTVDKTENTYANQNGESVNTTFGDAIMNELNELSNHALEESRQLAVDQPFLDVLDNLFNNYLHEKIEKENLTPVEIKLIRALYKHVIIAWSNFVGCDPLKTLSAQGNAAFQFAPGNQNGHIHGGFGAIVNYFVSQISPSAIKLNQAVKLIDYTNDKVRVMTANGQNYEADHIVVTVPLGVLKNEHKSLFQPALPQLKIDAINKIGFGLHTKIFLVFDNPFASNLGNFRILWSTDIDTLALPSMLTCGIQNMTFFDSILRFSIHPKLQNVIDISLTGPSADQIEFMTDECLLNVLHEWLNRAFPQVFTVAPKNILRSKWQSNEFYRGSYSHLPMGSSVNNIKTLGEPVGSKLFFAGEATIANYYGTTHAAYLSGLRVADSILKLYKSDELN